MAGITIYEFEALVAMAPGAPDAGGFHPVPPSVFTWLESQALRAAEASESAWVRVTQRRGRKAVQVTSFVGVISSMSSSRIRYWRISGALSCVMSPDSQAATSKPNSTATCSGLNRSRKSCVRASFA